MKFNFGRNTRSVIGYWSCQVQEPPDIEDILIVACFYIYLYRIRTIVILNKDRGSFLKQKKTFFRSTENGPILSRKNEQILTNINYT